MKTLPVSQMVANMWLVLVLMLLLEGTAALAIHLRYRFKGLDCCTPARARYGLVKNVCKAPSVQEKNVRGSFNTSSKTEVVGAYLCTDRTTKVTGM